MTEEAAIETAREYAAQRHYDPDEYEASAECNAGQWHVFFRGKEQRPGNFFSVFIDDESQTVTELVPGK
jgi:hypothetical protein